LDSDALQAFNKRSHDAKRLSMCICFLGVHNSQTFFRLPKIKRAIHSFEKRANKQRDSPKALLDKKRRSLFEHTKAKDECTSVAIDEKPYVKRQPIVRGSFRLDI